MGYKDGQRKPQPTKEQLQWAASLFRDGLSRKEVSRTTGISVFFLQKYLPNDKWGQEDVVIYAMARRMENQIRG